MILDDLSLSPVLPHFKEASVDPEVTVTLVGENFSIIALHHVVMISLGIANVVAATATYLTPTVSTNTKTFDLLCKLKIAFMS